MFYYTDIFIKLLLATFLGGIIGMERESLNRPAGFRTHILVCVGAALTMLVSISIFENYGSNTNVDPGRIAAQVVSGIGFLGAGTIIREGATVKGLTTAASLWTVASIGLAVGSGYYVGAVLATGIVFLTLIFLTKIENLIISKRHIQVLQLIIEDRPGQLGKIGSKLGEMGISIRNLKMEHTDNKRISLTLFLRVPSNIKVETVVNSLLPIEGIYNINTD